MDAVTEPAAAAADDADRHGVGANKPPAPMGVAAVHEYLADEFSHLLKRRDDLTAAIGRFLGAHQVIESDDLQGKAADFVKQIKAHVAILETRRKESKEPFLAGGRAVDAWFSGAKEPLADGVAKIERIMTAYAQRIEAERRAAAAAEAKRLADEAAAAEQRALDERAPEAFARAIEKHQAADAAAAVAAAKPADLSRAHGDYGAVASLRRSWRWEVTDIRKVPAHMLAVIDKEVRDTIKGQPEPYVPGLNFIEETKIQTR